MVFNTGLPSYYMEYLYDTSPYGYNGVIPQGPAGNKVVGLKPTKAVSNPQGLIPSDKYAADDGKISLKNKLKNFGKGIGKFFTGMFTDNDGKFSITRTLRTAALAVGIGAACVLTAGTAIPAMIAAGAVATSGISLVKGAVRASKAKTDAEAETAWQSIGSSTTALGLSVVGAKAVAKSMPGANAARYSGIKGYWNGTIDVFKTSWNAGKNSLSGIKNAWITGDGFLGKLNAVKNNIAEQGKSLGENIKSNYQKSTTRIREKISNETSKLQKRQAKYEKLASKSKGKLKEYWQHKADKTRAQIDAKNQINAMKSFDDAQVAVDKTNSQIAEKIESLKSETLSNADRAKLNRELEILRTAQKAQQEALTRKTTATNVIEDRIAAKQRQLDALDTTKPENLAKINELKAEIQKLDSSIEFKTSKTLARRQSQNVEDARIAAETAKNKYETAVNKHAADKIKLDEANKLLEEANKNYANAIEEYKLAVKKGEGNIDAAKAKLETARIAKEQAEQLAIHDYNYNGYGTHPSYGEATQKAVEFGKAENNVTAAQEQLNAIKQEQLGNIKQARGNKTNQELNAADAKGIYDNSGRVVNDRFIENSRAQGHLDNELAWKEFYDNKVAAHGPDTRGSRIPQAARELYLDAKNNPSANWLTMEYSGRKQWYPTYNPLELPQENTIPQQQIIPEQLQ